MKILASRTQDFFIPYNLLTNQAYMCMCNSSDKQGLINTGFFVRDEFGSYFDQILAEFKEQNQRLKF